MRRQIQVRLGLRQEYEVGDEIDGHTVDCEELIIV